MKRLAILLIVLSLVLVGCSQSLSSSSLPENASTNEEEETPEVILPNEPPEDVTWISPGKIRVGNFYPGARAEWNLLIHNGNNITASFAVTYRHPDHVGEGYVKPPEEAQDWVIIVDTAPVLAPRETREILVVLAMPRDAAVFAPEWEFWVSVKDTTQIGMVQTELCCRWLITMR